MQNCISVYLTTTGMMLQLHALIVIDCICRHTVALPLAVVLNHLLLLVWLKHVDSKFLYELNYIFYVF